MSRIHEALQRATEQGTSPAAETDASADATVAGQEINALSREPFPVELAGVRRRRPAPEPPPPTPTPTPVELAEVREDVRAEDPSTESAPRTLFERIDARLAEKVVV